MVARKKMLVAYEMGLGKTCMTIAALEKLKEEGTLTKPTLVIALSSLKYQWQKEINKFSDDYASVVDGSKSTRMIRWSRDMEWEDHTGYIIANYETVVADWDGMVWYGMAWYIKSSKLTMLTSRNALLRY